MKKRVNIRTKLDENGQTCPSVNISFPVPTTKLSEFHPVNENIVLQLIKKSSNACCELDPVSTKLLKNECLVSLLPSIVDIINTSLKSGSFPFEFKSAYVLPLLKKLGLDKEEHKNYRPVSNLSFLSKLLEKVVAIQLKDHLSSTGLEETFQSAYRKGHSTETALLRVQNDILSAIDKGKASCLVLLDLSAAFDTIDHSILLTFMHDHLGVEGNALQWFSSYLMDRQQTVLIDDSCSTSAKLEYGVPQGSVLGPLLFCVYLIPLGWVIKKHKMDLHIYADDTQVYCYFDPKSEQTINSALQSLKACIQDIRNWMSQARLKLNDEKTEFLVISSPRLQDSIKDLSLTIGDVVVHSSDKCRNL